ncbi:MAG: tRNA pseudouridine(38-40) synthase TruA [Prevotella sp.]|nr:tRNA pseudouridine(38-40) synthase TruA [Prevotella sp.]
MPRYMIHLSYDGTSYHGWQIQPHSSSVQEELQKALSTLLRRETEVVGAGRTDTGVHARHMTAHFDLEGELDTAQLAYRLNRILPRDIAIGKIEPVADDMHARFSATARTYHYYIHTKKDPFRSRYSLETHFQLDFAKMNEAAEILLLTEDFGAFCKSHSDVKTTICHVSEARWIQQSETEWYFRITANRFLRNMVRAVVGTLIEVGREKITIEDFRHIIEGKKRTEAGESMPAHALFLEKVEYV